MNLTDYYNLLIENLDELDEMGQQYARQDVQEAFPFIIPHVIEGLKHPAYWVRCEAAYILGVERVTIGIPFLIETLQDNDEHVRNDACRALENMNNQDLISYLATLSSNSDIWVQKLVDRVKQTESTLQNDIDSPQNNTLSLDQLKEMTSALAQHLDTLLVSANLTQDNPKYGEYPRQFFILLKKAISDLPTLPHNPVPPDQTKVD